MCQYCKKILIILCCIVVVKAQEEQDFRTRIGIMNPEVSGGGERFKEEVLGTITTTVNEIGMYHIVTQEDMEKGFGEIQEKFPRYCREPRCVSAVGSALQLDRMLYGSVDKGDKTYGVRLTLVDVASKQIIEKVTLEGEPGVRLEEVIKAAVNQIHGYTDENLDAKMHTYYGKQVHNEKLLGISAGACVAAGVTWALINRAFVDEHFIDPMYIDYTLMESDKKALSGIGTSIDLISLFSRPGALGNCYVAASDDAYGVFFNPAGLSWAAGAEVSLGYQYRFGLNNFAVSYSNKATREIGFGQGFIYNGDSEKLFSEVYFISSIAYKFNELVSFLRPLSVGASIKVISKKTANETVSPSSICGIATGLGLDIGAQLEVSERIRGGILLKNVPTVIRWENKSTGKKYFENEPVEFIMGGIFQANYETFLICEGRIPLYEDQVWKGACGIERTIFRVIRIRIGTEKSEGIDTPWKITGGFGLHVKTDWTFGDYFTLDGSYEYNTFSPFSNVMNFSFRFGF